MTTLLYALLVCITTAQKQQLFSVCSPFTAAAPWPLSCSAEMPCFAFWQLAVQHLGVCLLSSHCL